MHFYYCFDRNRHILYLEGVLEDIHLILLHFSSPVNMLLDTFGACMKTAIFLINVNIHEMFYFHR